MALGANVRDVLRLILGQAFGLVMVGYRTWHTSFACYRTLNCKLVIRSDCADPATLMVVSLTLVLVAIVACYVPARCAMKIDPIEDLRYEQQRNSCRS